MFNDPQGQHTPLTRILAAEAPTIPADWGQGRTAFGGLSTFLVARSMLEAARTTPARPLQSISVHFVGPVPIGSVEVTSSVLRTGRYMTQTAGTLRRRSDCARGAGAHGQPRTSQRCPPPAQSFPLRCAPQHAVHPGLMPAFTQHVDYRWATDDYPFTGGTSPLIRAGVLDEAVPVDPATVLLLIDAWPAGILTMAPQFVAASSVLWMVSFFEQPPFRRGAG